MSVASVVQAQASLGAPSVFTGQVVLPADSAPYTGSTATGLVIPKAFFTTNGRFLARFVAYIAMNDNWGWKIAPVSGAADFVAESFVSAVAWASFNTPTQSVVTLQNIVNSGDVDSGQLAPGAGGPAMLICEVYMTTGGTPVPADIALYLSQGAGGGGTYAQLLRGSYVQYGAV